MLVGQRIAVAVDAMAADVLLVEDRLP
jgi:hypothetical protein